MTGKDYRTASEIELVRDLARIRRAKKKGRMMSPATSVFSANETRCDNTGRQARNHVRDHDYTPAQ